MSGNEHAVFLMGSNAVYGQSQYKGYRRLMANPTSMSDWWARVTIKNPNFAATGM